MAFRTSLVRWQKSDFVRLVEHENVTLAMVANAVEPYRAVCPAASGLVLDAVETLWPETSGTLRARLLEVFRVAEERMWAFEGESQLYPPLATMMVVASQGAEVCVAWIGPDVAFHVRGAQITKTTPHTLFEANRHKPLAGHNALHVAHAKTIVTRYIGSGPKPDSTNTDPSFATFAVEGGDALVLVRDGELTSDVIVREAAARAHPAKLSRRLARLAFAEREFVTAVAVLRFDSDGAPYR